MTEELKPCPCREAFEKFLREKHFSNDKENVWGGVSYKNPHIEIMWYGWQAVWNTRHGEK